MQQDRILHDGQSLCLTSHHRVVTYDAEEEVAHVAVVLVVDEHHAYEECGKYHISFLRKDTTISGPFQTNPVTIWLRNRIVTIEFLNNHKKTTISD